ncbi:hypothetical protein E4U43_003161 [Claviceps pusilla]|uniref:Xylanolytic transcriptional activator regulatory domain-containing protein n=1 Tax=Claviceps pusilla TaxID=123648 RepID=A0A9P7NGK1_9HYPO|nr:hypothetical protein E4U43_003161 [Claviceps pusilla]
MREKKKRGKASRKDLAERAAAQAAAVSSTSHGDISDGKESSHSPNTDERSDHLMDSIKSDTMSTTSLTSAHGHGLGDNTAIDADFHHRQSASSTPGPYGDLPDHPHLQQHPIQITSDGLNGGRPMQMSGYTNMSTSYDRQSMASDDMMGGGQAYTTHPHQNSMHPYPDMAYGVMGQSPTEFHNTGNFRMSASPMGGYHHPMTASASPAWAMPISPPPSQFQPPMQSNDFGHNAPRYPVLQPLLPHLTNIMPVRLACDLIDSYFASSSSTAMHPTSPYILGSVFRKRAICHPTKPRKCQPALLASMLWVAAQTSEAALLTSVPSSRGKTCQKLLELTISLLRPLMHNPSTQPSSNPDNSPTSASTGLNNPLGAVLPGSLGSIDAALHGQPDASVASSQLDDLVTYIHLATVVSASEYKGSSLRWWNVAWSLARELKLGRELPPSELRSGFEQHDMDTDGLDEHDRARNTPGMVTEEMREERRRVWWLVYIVDRHLALCYNRPLFLLDVECEGLRQPLDDAAWQMGDFRPHSAGTDDRSSKHNGDLTGVPSGGEDGGRRSGYGSQFEFKGYSIYGYFLPLMMILGEIVDLHHARNHPRFGTALRASREWGVQVSEVRSHLESYEESLKRFESRSHLQNNDGSRGESGGLKGYIESHRGIESNGSPSAHSVHTSSSRITEAEVHTRTILAYGTHVMHVLHILLEGKWDPISLLGDEDSWISSPEFAKASGHAVAAAEALGQILEYDSGLELMPFFFGVYLLQGSFLLLVMADKMQGEASPNVVRACETVVRAHDACVVTLSTDYQRKFSKIMRGALALVRGRIPEDLGEQLQRRRELLSLYRWTGDGTGLAL